MHQSRTVNGVWRAGLLQKIQQLADEWPPFRAQARGNLLLIWFLPETRKNLVIVLYYSAALPHPMYLHSALPKPRVNLAGSASFSDLAFSIDNTIKCSYGSNTIKLPFIPALTNWVIYPILSVIATRQCEKSERCLSVFGRSDSTRRSQHSVSIYVN